MSGNAFVALMLRSPLHPLMGNTMLLTVRGRRSGRPIGVPVNYVRHGGELWVLSLRTRKWWRNIASDSPVELQIGGRHLTGKAELVLAESEVGAHLTEYIHQLPGSARALGIAMKPGFPDPLDLERVACERLFIRIRPNA